MAATFFQKLMPILWVILFFGGSIFVHELGHLIAAKKRNLFVPKFSIGFGPKICGFKYKGTEFIISLLPLGGYVAIPQLADLKSLEGEFDLPEDLSEATVADKTITAAAGPIANIIFAIVLSVIVYFSGLPVSEESLSTHVGYVPKTLKLSNGTEVPCPAFQAGIEANDKILSIDSHVVRRFDDISQFIALGTKKDSDENPLAVVKIDRAGEVFEAQVMPQIISASGTKDDKIRVLGILPKQTLIISDFLPRSFAKWSGLKKGDKIVAVNKIPVFSAAALHDLIRDKDSVRLTVDRDGKIFNYEVATTTLTTTKPFISMKSERPNGGIDIVANFDDETLGNTKYDRIKSLSFFCGNKFFLRQQGMENGDSIISVNDNEIFSTENLYRVVSNNNSLSLLVSTKLGFKNILLSGISDIKIFDREFTKILGLKFENIIVDDHPSPFRQIYNTVISTFKTLNSLFNKNSNISAKHLMGPAGLIKTLHTFAKTDFSWLLWFVILINVNLAILNLLPFPVLDGGIIAIAIISELTRSNIIEKIFSKIQVIFIVLLITLVTYVTFYDFKRIWSENYLDFEKSRSLRITLSHEIAT